MCLCTQGGVFLSFMGRGIKTKGAARVLLYIVKWHLLRRTPKALVARCQDKPAAAAAAKKNSPASVLIFAVCYLATPLSLRALCMSMWLHFLAHTRGGAKKVFANKTGDKRRCGVSHVERRKRPRKQAFLRNCLTCRGRKEIPKMKINLP